MKKNYQQLELNVMLSNTNSAILNSFGEEQFDVEGIFDNGNLLTDKGTF